MAFKGELQTIIPGVTWRRETKLEVEGRVSVAESRLETATHAHISSMERFTQASSQEALSALLIQRHTFANRANAASSRDLDSRRRLQLHLGSHRIPFIPDLRGILKRDRRIENSPLKTQDEGIDFAEFVLGEADEFSEALALGGDEGLKDLVVQDHEIAIELRSE